MNDEYYENCMKYRSIEEMISKAEAIQEKSGRLYELDEVFDELNQKYYNIGKEIY